MLSRPCHLQQHFPHMTDVILLSCRFDISAFNTSLFSQYGIKLPSKLSKAVPKRQAEFLAGRFLAKSGLTELSQPDEEIINGDDRCPIWPKHIIGSITHSNENAACAITTSSHIHALGIDLEYDINQKSCNDIYKSIINKHEETLLRGANIPFNQAVTLAFSAKESLYKALYPQIKQFFNFDAAAIIALDLEQQRLTFELTQNWSADFLQGQHIDCYFIRFKTSYLTTVTLLT